MNRPSFLSNKQVTCDFCGLYFIDNINKANLFMCDRCLRYLCSASDEQKINFLGRFKDEKDKEKVIKRFINEEVLDGETKSYAGHITGRNNNKGILPEANKIWEIPYGIFLDPSRPKAL